MAFTGCWSNNRNVLSAPPEWTTLTDEASRQLQCSQPSLARSPWQTSPSLLSSFLFNMRDSVLVMVTSCHIFNYVNRYANKIELPWATLKKYTCSMQLRVLTLSGSGKVSTPEPCRTDLQVSNSQRTTSLSSISREICRGFRKKRDQKKTPNHPVVVRMSILVFFNPWYPLVN